MDFESYLSLNLFEAQSDQQHADKLRHVAEKHSEKISKQDYNTLHSIADHVDKGQHGQAWKKLHKLDMSTMHKIPNHTWNHIDKHGSK